MSQWSEKKNFFFKVYFKYVFEVIGLVTESTENDK